MRSVRGVPGAIPKEIYAFLAACRAGRIPRRLHESRSAQGAVHRARRRPQLDEWPVLTKSFTQPLERNMALAIEPKIVFPEGAVGVEDIVLVTEHGGRVITQLERPLIRVAAREAVLPDDENSASSYVLLLRLARRALMTRAK